MADERTLLDRLSGKGPMRKSDIDLPNHSGRTDPRLTQGSFKEVAPKVLKGFRGVRELAGKR